jgi:hypothetical protein
MASNVERVIDFLDRQATNTDLPKMLVEDIQWAIDVISANKLYKGNLDNINFNTMREEVNAWIDRISHKVVPSNIEEEDRLKQYEELIKNENQKRKGPKKPTKDNPSESFNPEDTQ